LRQAKVGAPAQGSPLIRSLLWFPWLAILLIITGLAVCLACSQLLSSNSYTGSPKAAIIDQLHSSQPNDELITQVTQDLEVYGFTVDVYQGNDVTVDLYRKLPKYGYKLIIFRAHSGLIEAEGQKRLKTAIFTNEPYSSKKYLAEQLNHKLPMVRVGEDKAFFFGIDSKFVMESMKRQFEDTVVIIAGCSCLYFDDMAQAFINKGASVYLAWDRSVDANYVDAASAYLVRRLCTEGVTIKEAVSSTMIEKGRDPTYHATLKYFPPESGDKTLKQLISTVPQCHDTSINR